MCFLALSLVCCFLLLNTRPPPRSVVFAPILSIASPANFSCFFLLYCYPALLLPVTLPCWWPTLPTSLLLPCPLCPSLDFKNNLQGQPAAICCRAFPFMKCAFLHFLIIIFVISRFKIAICQHGSVNKHINHIAGTSCLSCFDASSW